MDINHAELNLSVVIAKGDGTHVMGKITRIWPNGLYVTVLVNGRSTYVRDARNVSVGDGHLHPSCACTHEPIRPCDHTCSVHHGTETHDSFGRKR